jgi:hypothetical protein
MSVVNCREKAFQGAYAMGASLQLDRMSTQDKLRAMEELWAELSRTPEAVPVPEWHREVLNVRERAVADGEATFVDWDDARRRLLDQTR